MQHRCSSARDCCAKPCGCSLPPVLRCSVSRHIAHRRGCMLAERARPPCQPHRRLTEYGPQLLRVLRRYTLSSGPLSTRRSTERAGEPPDGAAQQPQVQSQHHLHTAARCHGRLHMPRVESTPCHAAARPPLRLAAASPAPCLRLRPRFSTFPRRRPYARHTWTLTASLGSIVAYSPSCAR